MKCLPRGQHDAFRRRRHFARRAARPCSSAWRNGTSCCSFTAKSTGDDVDPYDRESVFIERVLAPLVKRHPRLRIVLEHVTTRAGVEFVRARGPRRRRDDHAAAPAAEPRRDVPGRPAAAPLLPAGAEARTRPRGADRSRDVRTIRSSSSAPTARRTRRRPRNRPAAAPASSRRRRRSSSMRARSSRRAASTASRRSRVSTAPTSTACRATPGTIVLEREPWTVPESFPFGADEVVPMGAGEPLAWRLRDAASHMSAARHRDARPVPRLPARGRRRRDRRIQCRDGCAARDRGGD